MRSAEESIWNQTAHSFTQGGAELIGLSIVFTFSDGSTRSLIRREETNYAPEITVSAPVDVGEQAGNGEAVGSGDAQVEATPDPGPQEVDEAPMSKGKRKK